MRAPLLPLLGLLCACASPLPPKKSPASSSPVAWEKLWVQNGCSLYNFDRKLRTFPGDFCVFLDDGSFISATEKSMRRYSPTLEIVWETPGHFHHQLNLTPDKKRLLALSGILEKRKGKIFRDDELMILDLDGKILHRKKMLELFPSVSLSPVEWGGSPHIKALGADLETSHFNSIYEVPRNSYSGSIPWLRAGNIVVNGYAHGILFLSPNLSQVLKHVPYKGSVENALHDVQVTVDGRLLVFNNWVSGRENRSSAVELFDPVQGTTETVFMTDPPEAFYSQACGGVQELGKLYFISHITAGAYLWSPEKKKVLSYVSGTRSDPRGIEPTQQLKLVDAENFLKNVKD